jgi:hypothetical protein
LLALSNEGTPDWLRTFQESLTFHSSRDFPRQWRLSTPSSVMGCGRREIERLVL